MQRDLDAHIQSFHTFLQKITTQQDFLFAHTTIAWLTFLTV